MNRFYLIVPVVLLALFGGVYWQHSSNAVSEARMKAAATAEAKLAEETRKADAERKAREDADKRAAARLAEEQKKEDDKRIKWEADNAQIAADAARYDAQAATFTKELTALEKQLAEIRATGQSLNRQNFELARDVELARIAKRNAELEIQRTTEILARTAAATH